MSKPIWIFVAVAALAVVAGLIAQSLGYRAPEPHPARPGDSAVTAPEGMTPEERYRQNWRAEAIHEQRLGGATVPDNISDRDLIYLQEHPRVIDLTNQGPPKGLRR